MAVKVRSWDIYTIGATVLPALSIFLAQAVSVMPWGFDGRFIPWLAAGLVFYWSLFRPQRMPLLLCFLLGIMEDSLRGQPLGLYAMFYLLIRQVADSQRRFLLHRPFNVAWLAFSLTIATLLVIEAFIMKRFLEGGGLLYALRFAVTALFFPFIYTAVAQLHMYLRQGGESA